MRALTVIMVLSSACRIVPVPLDNRACEEGRCSSGYVCHPLLDVCVRRVIADCQSGVCPSKLKAGDACDLPRSYVPCATFGSLDCTSGCRTCTGDRVWSECSTEVDQPLTAAGVTGPTQKPMTPTGNTAPSGSSGPTGPIPPSGPTCLASTETCNGVDDDCDGGVDELSDPELATGCQAQLPNAHNVGAWACDRGACQALSCLGGWADTNSSLEDGCEGCGTTGLERCGDALDNDCNGETDEAGAVGCDLRFYDGDHDGDGIPTLWRCVCVDAAPYDATNVLDCDDTSALCSRDCSDADGDSIPDCRDDCVNCAPSTMQLSLGAASQCETTPVTITLDNSGGALANLRCAIDETVRHVLDRATFDFGEQPWADGTNIRHGFWSTTNLACAEWTDGLLELREGGGAFRRTVALSTVGYEAVTLSASVNSTDDPAQADITARACCGLVCSAALELIGPATTTCAVEQTIAFGPEANGCAELNVEWVFVNKTVAMAVDDIIISAQLVALPVSGDDGRYTSGVRVCSFDPMAQEITLTCRYDDGASPPVSGSTTMTWPL